MARGQSPLVGYNTNVRHKSKLYHIQTEDSGVSHPHIITHLFADGGRIVASKKTGYAQHVGAETLHEIVKKLMQEQHKAMFIALRDCAYDEDEPGAGATADDPSGASPDATHGGKLDPARIARQTDPPELDLDALDRAAEAHLAGSAAAKVKLTGTQLRGTKRSGGRYQHASPVQAKPVSQAPKAKPSSSPQASIFNGQVLRGKSLDEVILSYLSDDTGEER
jgi:hypothetical protein